MESPQVTWVTLTAVFTLMPLACWRRFFMSLHKRLGSSASLHRKVSEFALEGLSEGKVVGALQATTRASAVFEALRKPLTAHLERGKGWAPETECHREGTSLLLLCSVPATALSPVTATDLPQGTVADLCLSAATWQTILSSTAGMGRSGWVTSRFASRVSTGLVWKQRTLPCTDYGKTTEQWHCSTRHAGLAGLRLHDVCPFTGMLPNALRCKNMQELLDFTAQHFNAIRMPFSAELALNMESRQPGNIDYAANPDLQGLTTGQVMDR